MANEIDIYQGNNRTIEVTLVDSDGAAFDLTNTVVSFTVKKYETDSVALISKTSAVVSEISISSPATLGIFEVFLLPGDTEDLAGNKVYDITVVSGGKTYTVVKSDFDILLPVKS